MQFIAVSILVAGWAEAVFLTTKIRRMMKISFVAINVILIAFTIGTGLNVEATKRRIHESKRRRPAASSASNHEEN